ncbi:hypothetical protein CFII64_28899 [Pseudomonas sp. CFII64]|nr:hypothetical protein CFII64_28899 [Pseudomonas sp. CFII64]
MDAMGNPVCKKWVGLESPPKKAPADLNLPAALKASRSHSVAFGQKEQAVANHSATRMRTTRQAVHSLASQALHTF